MSKKIIHIDGFWLFLILVFVVVPCIKSIFNRVDQETIHEVKDKIVATDRAVRSKANIIEITDNTAIAPVNSEVKIPIKKGTIRVTKVSPYKIESKVKNINSKYVISIFDQEGSWELNMYDKDGILIDWIKITVY